MRLSLLIFFLLNMISVSGQPAIAWQKTYGGSANDAIYEIDVHESGYYLGGISGSNISGEKGQNSRGGNDCWLLSINTSGQILWQRTIGGSLDDGIRSLCKTSDGGVIIGGGSTSNISGEKSENCRGFADYWIVKLDFSGNIEWQRTIGGDASDGLRTLRQTSDGGYIVGGLSQSGISGEKSEIARGIFPTYDYWILKLDAQGNIEWQKTYGGDDYDDLIVVRQTSDSGYILAGNSISNAGYDKAEDSRGSEDYWILRLDSNGEILWQKTFGGSDVDNVNDIIENNEGGFYVGGFSFSGISGDKTFGNYGVADFWLLKLDANGNQIWQRTIGGDEGDFLYSLYVNNDNTLIASGLSYSGLSGEKTESSRGSSDMWFLKLNEFGDILWQKTIGGSEGDGIKCVKKTSENEYLLGGNSRSSISGEKNENCRGETDYWFVKLANENLSNAESFFQNSISVYPTVTAGEVSIVLNDSISIERILLTNSLGKTVTLEKESFDKISISGSSGLYLLTVYTTDGQKQTFKIIKVNR